MTPKKRDNAGRRTVDRVDTPREATGMSSPTEVEFEDYPDQCEEFDCEDGWILNDCIEDCCACLEPWEEHGFRPCPSCNPSGRQA